MENEKNFKYLNVEFDEHEHCDEEHCGHHHHHHEHEQVEISKYESAFKKFDLKIDDETVCKRVHVLVERDKEIIKDKQTLIYIFNSIELTTLKETDNEDSVFKLINQVNEIDTKHPEWGNVATVCVYPVFAELCHDNIENEKVKVACVSGGFPSSQTFSEIKIAETAMALHEGADEIDMVMSVGTFLSEDYETVADEIEEMKEVCREHHLKVILETGSLPNLTAVKKAAIIAMYSGADFIKTSTGKAGSGATPETVYVMCEAAKEYHRLTGRKVGIKVAGGVRTTEEAVAYYAIVKEMLGKEWLENKLFRIGASSLLNDIIRNIES